MYEWSSTAIVSQMLNMWKQINENNMNYQKIKLEEFDRYGNFYVIPVSR